MTRDEYKALDAINWSTLREMRRSPKHYQYRLTNPPVTTPAMRLGQAVHTAVLEPDRFLLDYALFEGERRAGKAWDAFEAAHAGKTILKAAEYELCLAIRDAVRAHPVAQHLVSHGVSERCTVWTDAATGLRCKGRPDFLNGIGLVELKSTGDADPRRFGYTAGRLGYHAQLAFYMDGLLADGEPVQAVKILAVETAPPWDVLVFRVSDSDLFAGQEEYRDLLRQVVTCREKNAWPGRSEAEVPLELPRWIWDEDEDATGLGLVITERTGG